MRRPAALFAAAALLAARPASAQNGIDAQIHKPAMDPFGIFSIERAVGPKKHDLGFRFGVNFAASPLKLDTVGSGGPPDGTSETVLDSQLTFNLGLAFGVTSRLTVALDVPLQRQPLGEGYGKEGRYTPFEDPSQAQPGTGFYSVRAEQNVLPSENHPGDTRVGAKLTLLRGKLNVAAQATVYVPFGDEEVFAGSQSFTYEPKLIVDLNLGRGVIAFNAGARLRDGVLAETREVDNAGFVVNDAMGNAQFHPILFVGNEALVGAGARFAVTPQVSVGGEAYALIPISKASDADCPDPCKNGDMTADALGGVWFQVSNDTWVSAAAGVGVISDAARRDSFRMVAAISWTPTPEGARSGGRGDRDGDNLPDAADVCPDDPEDPDDFQDDDGCPELDNDLDGVLDAQDKCAAEPEDRDGFDDGDGCPEGDDDKDGIEDLTDRCRTEPEDKDNFQDDDGCPDEDNDGDGILDAKDKCADEAETVNGVDDMDGCPDQAVQGGPKLAQDRIDLQGERIEFTGKTAKLTKASEQTLEGVADVLKANPTIRVRVEVGVEASGDKKADKDRDRRLTAERAATVEQSLLQKGVKPEQITLQPLGSDFPIDAKNPKDAKLNRRVEFIRVTQ